MGKKRVELNRINWDAECFQDLSTGRGFLITDPPTFEWEGSKTKSMFGPQSPLYGTSITDDQELSTRFRCKCGEFTGKAFRGETCPKCLGKIEFRDVDPNITGWIPIENGAKLINPLYYRMLSSVIGEEEFKDIVVCQRTVDRDGIRRDLTKEDLKEINPSTPFHGIGIEGLRKQYYDVLDYAEKGKKKSSKKATIDILRNESCKVFTSYVPVYTPLLRQSSVSGDSYYYTGIDKHINPLCNLSRNLVECNEIDKDLILNRMQTRVNSMWEINFSELDGKDGLIRDQINGGSLR